MSSEKEFEGRSHLLRDPISISPLVNFRTEVSECSPLRASGSYPGPGTLLRGWRGCPEWHSGHGTVENLRVLLELGNAEGLITLPCGLSSLGSLPDHPERLEPFKRKNPDGSWEDWVSLQTEEKLRARAVSPTLGRKRRSGSSHKGKEKMRCLLMLSQEKQMFSLAGPLLYSVHS